MPSPLRICEDLLEPRRGWLATMHGIHPGWYCIVLQEILPLINRVADPWQVPVSCRVSRSQFRVSSQVLLPCKAM